MVMMVTMLTVYLKSGFVIWIMIVLIVLMSKIVVSFKSVLSIALTTQFLLPSIELFRIRATFGGPILK